MFIVAKSPIIAIGLIAVIITGVAVASSTVLTYNSLVSKQATVQAQWAQVENQYQRKIENPKVRGNETATSTASTTAVIT